MAQAVNDLLDQTRSQLDEKNIDNATDSELVQALNRAQRSATNIVARKYPDMFWDTTTDTLVANQQEYDIPANAYGKRIELIEVDIGGTRYELKPVSNKRTTVFTRVGAVDRPYYYSLVKNKIAIHPLPSAAYTLYIHYLRRPETLVLSQGRITTVNSGSNYVLVDELGDAVSTSVTGFGSYINVIDYITGEVKGTLQVSALDTSLNKVLFKSAGLTRSTVLGRSISTSLPTDISVDDYLALVTGTSVSELDEAYTDYLVQFAVIEIQRRFKVDIADDLIALKALSEELENMWVGREQSTKIRRANTHYHSTTSRRLVP